MTSDYNGYKNYDTWNVSLWINNTEHLYLGAVEFMKDVNPLKDPYKGFVISCGLSAQETADGIAYMSDALDYDQLDEMMRELI
jgi:hypothetical protein